MMDRLTEKLALAASVVSTQTTMLENDADALIARGAEFSRRRSATFAAQHAVLDQGDKGMDALDAKLALLSNDPTPSSGGSSAAVQEPLRQASEPPNNIAPHNQPALHPQHQALARAVPSRRDL